MYWVIVLVIRGNKLQGVLRPLSFTLEQTGRIFCLLELMDRYISSLRDALNLENNSISYTPLMQVVHEI